MKIEIKKYLDAYQYLQDAYKELKAENPEFSFETWSKILKASDKSYVRFMIMGKRNINEAMTEAFAESLQLDSSDKEYFKYLVQYTQSRTPEQKELLGKKLVSLLQMEFDQEELSAQYDFLSNPLLPRLQVLLSLSDIDSSADNLAWILGCSADEAEESLQKLVQMKLVEKSESGYRSLSHNFKVPDSHMDLGLEAFYMKSLETAKNAIHQPKEDRKFKSLFLPLNKKEMDQFLLNLQNFVREQLALFNPSKYEDRRLYQVQMNIVAVSSPKKALELSPQRELTDL